MRLFTFFLAFAALFAAGGSASADTDGKWAGRKVTAVGDAVQNTADVAEGFYLLRHENFKVYLNENAAGEYKLNNIFSEVKDSPTATELTAALAGTDKLSYVVHLAKTADGKYTIQSHTGRYVGTIMQRSVGLSSVPEAEKEKFALRQYQAGQFIFDPLMSFFSLNCQGREGDEGNLVGYNYTGTPTEYPQVTANMGRNFLFLLHPVTLEEDGVFFQPEEGKYYAIKTAKYAEDGNNDYNNNLCTDQATARTDGVWMAGGVNRSNKDASVFPQLMKFVPVSGQTNRYYIYNPNTGAYFGKLTEANQKTLPLVAAMEDAGVYKFPQTAEEGVYNIVCDGHYVNTFGLKPTEGDLDVVGTYDAGGANAAGNKWKIEQKTALVKIGDTGWASLCAPVDIKAHSLNESYFTNGLTIYTATEVNSTSLTLSVLRDKGDKFTPIPAGTGVLINYPDGAASLLFDISYESASPITGNKLQGATAKRTGFAGGANYFLATGSDGKACLLKADDAFTVVPANKAYLPATEVPGGTMAGKSLAFSFGGTPTGVGSAVQSAAEREDTYYDLNGRRVLFPRTGVYVTGSGKKVFLK